MINSYLVLKLAHVLGACVLFGTGMGIAFFMWMAHRTQRSGRFADGDPMLLWIAQICAIVL